jgi:hypothetical protein
VALAGERAAAVQVPARAPVALEVEVLERAPAVQVAAPQVEPEAAVRVPAQGLAPVPAAVPARPRVQALDPARTPRWARARMLPWVPAPMLRQLLRASEKDTHSATAPVMEPEIRGSDRRMERVSDPGPASAALRVLALVTVPGITAQARRTGAALAHLHSDRQ